MQGYTAPRATVQQVLQQHHGYEGSCPHTNSVLQRLRNCRTSVLGFHLYRCSNEDCHHIKYQYHSCRDQQCPQCGALKKQDWIEARTNELLPVKYYHVVFTLPHELNSLVMGHRSILYKLLFDASSQTLLKFAADPKWLGAMPGIISVLHTWGQQLSFHPHIHCIVSGGGITGDSKWKEATKNDWRFLFPVDAMAEVYRGKFLHALKKMIRDQEVTLAPETGIKALFNLLYQKEWVVYAKAPFGGPQSVIEYLGRYTHKVAISNHRIVSVNGEKDIVTFDYKDYADENAQKQMSLNSSEFLRRFEQHILPKRFTKIRTYGYLSNRNRQQRINEVLDKMELPVHKARVKIPLEVLMMERYGVDIYECPCCKKRTMQLVQVYLPWKHADDG